MPWVHEGVALAPGSTSAPDSLRAWEPWVLEAAGGGLRMWYCGHDGTTSRILEAAQRPGAPWERIGVAVDAGLAGVTDKYGVECPCVVKTPGGYLMAYAGFDGTTSRVHMATSQDGHTWVAQGTVMQRTFDDLLGANHPRLFVTGERWWLFFSGYAAPDRPRRSAVLAAVSTSGASWDRIGAVLEPTEDELAVSHPCAVEVAGRLYLFYASHSADRVDIAMATSTDGVEWDRRGTVLAPKPEGLEQYSVHTPCVLRRMDGSLQLWYSTLPARDTAHAYRICSATFDGPWST